MVGSDSACWREKLISTPAHNYCLQATAGAHLLGRRASACARRA
jgi:hypothetical protein